MDLFENRLKDLVRYMYYIAGFAIVVMMVITTTDVFMRFCVTLYAKFQWSFLESWKPIPGTYDLVAMAGSIAAALAMAHTTVESGHVAVSILTRLFTDKLRNIVRLITDILSGLLFGILSVQSVIYARDLKESGEVTMTMQLPFYPFVYLLALSAFTVTLIFLISVIKDIKEV